MKLAIGTLRYKSRKVFDEVLRHRLRELAGMHVRYGYRRLTVLLRREGWHVNAKRIYRLYREEELIVRTKQRRKMARRRPVPSGVASRPNQRWSMDFVSDRLADGRSFRILTVVDQFTRECVALEADRSMTGMKVAQVLDRVKPERDGLPESITVDNGSEFCSRALELPKISSFVCDRKWERFKFHSDGRSRVRGVGSRTMVNMSRLSNRVAIVTGASKGIGGGIATALGAAGARVA